MVSTNLKIKELLLKYPTLYKEKIYKKGVLLLEEGSMANSIYYVESGIIKTFLTNKDNRKEATITFFSDDELLLPYESFIKKIPTRVNIEVVKDAKVLVINRQNWEELNVKEPELNDLVTEITINTMYKIIENHYDIICCSVPERYRRLLERMPYLKGVSDNEIANCIGANRVTISNTRKDKKK